jgi:hypothetical protein
MRWHVGGSYLCSDSPPVSSGSLLDFQHRRPRGHDPGILLAPPTPSPLRKEMVPQSRLLAPALFLLAEYPCSTEKYGNPNGAQVYEIRHSGEGTPGHLLASLV